MKSIVSVSLLFFICIIAHAQEKEVIQKGEASFYAKKFNNRKTASGVIYKSNTFVCASNSFPFGTKLKVRNPLNKKEVVVEVIDRGAFKKGRIIDLSLIAARQLGIINQGIATVEVSKYTPSDSLTSLAKGKDTATKEGKL
ncbi:MAG: hypothetical protein RL662_474 [Bacteroidota bacterium]|jgi:rare lipoprotein A